MHLRGARDRAASCGSRLPPAAECQRGNRTTASAHPASSPAPLSPRLRSPGLPLPAGPPSIHPSLALPPPGARHFGGRRVRVPPCWGPPRRGAAITGCRHNGVPRTHHGAVQGSGPALPAWPPPRPRFKAPPPAPPCPPPSPGPWACPGEGGSGGAMPAAEGEGDEGDREPSASCGFCSECKQSITSPIKNIYSGYRSLPKMPFFFPPVFNKADFGV